MDDITAHDLIVAIVRRSALVADNAVFSATPEQLDYVYNAIVSDHKIQQYRNAASNRRTPLLRLARYIEKLACGELQ